MSQLTDELESLHRVAVRLEYCEAARYLEKAMSNNRYIVSLING